MEVSKQEIEEKIRSAIVKTEAQIAEFRELTKAIAPDVAIGRISRMDAINNKSVNESALRNAENKLVNLNRVLEGLNKEDFGKCLKCRTEIPLGRILIRPESLYCVNCAI